MNSLQKCKPVLPKIQKIPQVKDWELKSLEEKKYSRWISSLDKEVSNIDQAKIPLSGKTTQSMLKKRVLSSLWKIRTHTKNSGLLTSFIKPTQTDRCYHHHPIAIIPNYILNSQKITRLQQISSRKKWNLNFLHNQPELISVNLSHLKSTHLTTTLNLSNF